MNIRELEKRYGSIEYAGKTYILTNYADPTNRVLPDHQQKHFEISAPAIDAEGKKYILYWIFEDDGKDLDMYDYTDVDRVEVLQSVRFGV